MKMKKMLCVILTLAMLAGVLPMAALAADSDVIDLLDENFIVEGADHVVINGDGSWTITGNITLAPNVTIDYSEYAYIAQTSSTDVEFSVTLLDRDANGAYADHWINLYNNWEGPNYFPTGTYDSVNSLQSIYDWNVANSGWGNTGTATIRAIYIEFNGSGTVTLDTLELRTTEASSDNEGGDSSATKTIYFFNSEGWTDVYAYTYDNSFNPVGSAWPGDAMTRVSASIFSITLPADAARIVFNNGNSGDGNQSHDQEIPEDDRNLYMYNAVIWTTYSEGGDNVINNEEELYAALTYGGEYTLGNDLTIEPGWYYTVTQAYNVETVIDLGGYSLNSYHREIVVEAGSLTLKGGTISDTLLIVFGGSLTIQDAQITGHYGPLASGGNLELNNVAVTVQDLAIYAVNGTLTINGGTYTITDTNNDFFDVEDATVCITGGTFGADVSEYVADGYECVQSGDLWVVRSKTDDIKWQVTNGTNAESASTNLRLLTWVDFLENFSAVTFNVTINGKTAKLECTTVYTAILASGVAIRNPAETFKNEDAKYFATYTLKNVPSSIFDTPIDVTVTWTDREGNETTSETKTIVISSDWA